MPVTARLKPSPFFVRHLRAQFSYSAVEAGLAQSFLEAFHTDSSGGFRRARTTPMGFETDGVVVTILGEGAELAYPINDSRSHGRPLVLFTRLPHDIFCMAMPDALKRQQAVPVGIRGAAQRRGVSGVPVEHEVLVRNGFEDGGRLLTRGRVASHLIFQQQDQVALRAGLSGRA